MVIEVEGPVDIPIHQIREAFAPAAYVGLLGVSLIAGLLGFTSKNCSFKSSKSFWYSKLLAIVICAVTILFFISVSALAVAFSANQDTGNSCDIAFIFCACFWCSGKGLLYLWYIEKLYVHRNTTGLEKTRLNPFYFVNNLVVLAPYIAALAWLFKSRNVIVSRKAQCYLSLDEIPATSYLLCYTIVISGYITLSFLWPFSCLPERIRPRRRNSSIIPSHPAVRIPPNQRQRQRQRKSIYLHAGLNTLTSVLPVTIILFLMFNHQGKPWWVFAIATAVDLVLSCFVVSLVSCWENPKDRSMSMRAPERFEPPSGAPNPLQFSVCNDCAARGMRGSGLNWFLTPHM
ncbi:hypothetical protein BZA77DRAFT_43915 [Pyronema omphalodes]|nr:hypothetical protein BZA77DRAFT_43915 [Pyronema omphalodes]